MKVITIILMLAISILAYSQGKIKIDGSEITSMELTLYKVAKKQAAVKLDPATDVLAAGTRVQLQITVKLKNGTTMTSPLTGKDGLQMKQFDYQFLGATSPVAGTGSLIGVYMKAAVNARGTFIVNDGWTDMSKNGNIGLTITAWHEDTPEKKYPMFIAVERSKTGNYGLDYTGRHSGLSPNVDVSMDESNPKYPLLVKVTVPGRPNKTNIWHIDPTTEVIKIHCYGQNGGGGAPTQSHPTRSPGHDGGNGGNLTVSFNGNTEQYASSIVVLNSGGKGGRGGQGTVYYGPSGRDGRKGKVTIIVDGSSKVVSNSSGDRTVISTASSASPAAPARTVARVESKTPSKPENGMWEKKDNTSGKVVEKGMYKNGEQSGLWKFYDKEGQMKREANYEEGKYHGKVTDYFANGVVKNEGEYVDSKRVGTHTTYRDNGNKTYEWNYKAGGVKHGEHKEWHSNGQLETIETYQDGKITGPYKRFYDDGSKQIEATYINKKYTGLYTKYHKGNNQKKEEGNYKLGEEDGVWKEWGKKGTLSSEGKYEDGDKDGYWKFYSSSSGKISREGDYLGGKKDGTWKKYNSRGEPTGTEDWEEGKKVLD